MELRDEISSISENDKRSNPKCVAEKHNENPNEVNEHGSALPEAIPIDKHHNAKEIAEEFEAVDSGTPQFDIYIQIRARQGWIQSIVVAQSGHKGPGQSVHKSAQHLPVPGPESFQCMPRNTSSKQGDQGSSAF
jgi:hypothetical protein